MSDVIEVKKPCWSNHPNLQGEVSFFAYELWIEEVFFHCVRRHNELETLRMRSGGFFLYCSYLEHSEPERGTYMFPILAKY